MANDTGMASRLYKKLDTVKFKSESVMLKFLRKYQTVAVQSKRKPNTITLKSILGLGLKVKKYIKNKTGKSMAVSLEKSARVKHNHVIIKALYFFFSKNLIPQMKDNIENNVSKRSPLAGIHDAEEIKSGCAEYKSVPKNAYK